MPRKTRAQEIGEAAVPYGDPLADQLDRLLDIKQMAALMQCSTRMVAYMVRSGDFPPPIKIGHLSRWRARDYNAWVAKMIKRKRVAA